MGTSRKRKFNEIEENKNDEKVELLSKQNKQKEQTIEKLKEMIQKFELERLELIEDQDKLARLYELGVIDSKGESVPFNPSDEDDMK